MKYMYIVYTYNTMLEEWEEIEGFTHKADAEDCAYAIAIEEGIKTKVEMRV